MAKTKSKESVGEVLSKNLRALMAHNELLSSNNKVGRAVKIPPRTIGRIVNGEVSPQIDTLEKIATVFGVPSWCLLVPDLNPANPPIRAMTEDERRLYANLRAAVTAIPAER